MLRDRLPIANICLTDKEVKEISEHHVCCLIMLQEKILTTAGICCNFQNYKFYVFSLPSPLLI